MSNIEHKNTVQRDCCILMPTTTAKCRLTDVIFAKSFIPVDKQGERKTLWKNALQFNR